MPFEDYLKVKPLKKGKEGFVILVRSKVDQNLYTLKIYQTLSTKDWLKNFEL